MKIKFYGTAAVDGVPALFCKCRVCEKTRAEGGRNIRTRSQACIDDTLLIDLPPDTYMHAVFGGLPLQDIEHCLITHSHFDHFVPEELDIRAACCVAEVSHGFTVYGTNKVEAALGNRVHDQKFSERVGFSLIEPFVSFTAAGYRITPLAADHDAESGPVIFLIEKDGKTLLYGNDTGYFPEDTWRYFETERPKLDLAIFDCTFGNRPGMRNNHMNIQTVIEVRDRLKEAGCIQADTKNYLHHICHNSWTTHDEFCEIAAPCGFTVTYDGLEVEI